jgi:cobalamin-dependent methionine synthase I
MDVRHEHFASAVLGDFLRVVRQPLEDRASGPVAALATMPGELHGLGLQMAALVFALAGWRVVLLGTDTPVKQVSALAREAPLSAIAISVITSPAGKGSAEYRRSVALLRSAVPKHIPILIGGAGATGVRARRGVATLSDLYELDRWARSFSAA